MPVENLLKRFGEAARKSRADRFVNEHTGFYLLGKVARDSLKRNMSFHTGVRDSREMEALMDDEASPDEPGMRSGFFLLKVKKSGRNPWSSWVSVGRARNNDVVLRHLSVSMVLVPITCGTTWNLNREREHGDFYSSGGDDTYEVSRFADRSYNLGFSLRPALYLALSM